MPRIAIAQLSHETNVFSAKPTGMDEFFASGLLYGDAIVDSARGTNTCVAGFIDGADRHGFELVPILSVWATPSGIVTARALTTLTGELCDRITGAGHVDGVLLALHGAMVSDLDYDADAYILEAVRQAVGLSIPVVATLDLHANISERMVASADILVGYDTYPHIDMAERGREAAELLFRLIDGHIRPTAVLVKPPMLPTSQRMTTDREPMRRLIEAAHTFEAHPGVLNVTIAGGFPPADVVEAGASVLVTANNEPELARNTAASLAEIMWRHREEFLGGVDSFEAAASVIAGRSADDDGPLLLVDIGDNPWTGGPGDSAELLRFLLRLSVQNAAIALIADPESVICCIEAGVGSQVALALGGKTDTLHGPSLPVSGTIRMLSDGRYVNDGPMMAGVAVDLGPSAIVELEGIRVLVTSRAESPVDLNVFRSHGIEPTTLEVIGLKGKGHFRAAFGPIASHVVLVEGPGITGADFTRLPFQHIRRPIWPLDSGLEWHPPFIALSEK